MLDEWGELVCLQGSEDVTYDLGVLLDDGGEGDDEDNALMAMLDGVKKGEQK